MNSFWNLTQCCVPMCKSQPRSRKKVKYIPPPRTESCRPCRKYAPPEDKMEDRTIYSMSYSSPNVKNKDSLSSEGNRCQPQCPVCPCLFAQGPMWNFCDQTVQRASYQPWCVPKPEEMPWKRKPKYVPPKIKMENQTVHKLSYPPPGQFVEYTDDDTDSCFCPQMPPCEGPNMCCNPCCYQNCVGNRSSGILR